MEEESEKPCLYLEAVPGVAEIRTIPAVKGKKAQCTCHTTDPDECPKKTKDPRKKLNITMLCFRIRDRRPRKKKK